MQQTFSCKGEIGGGDYSCYGQLVIAGDELVSVVIQGFELLDKETGKPRKFTSQHTAIAEKEVRRRHKAGTLQ